MMTDPSILQQHQALVHELREMLLSSEGTLKKADEELVSFEVSCEQTEEALRNAENLVTALREKSQKFSLEKNQAEKKKNILMKKRRMMVDLMGLVSGHLFSSGNHGALFFTQSLAAFALEHGLGEMQAEEIIRGADLAGRCSFHGKMYAFVKGHSGTYYLHPEPVDNDLYAL